MKLVKKMILGLMELDFHLTAQSPSDGWKRQKVLAFKNPSERLEAVMRNVAGRYFPTRN